MHHRLSDLRLLSKPACELFTASLARNGYAKVLVDEDEHVQTLNRSLIAARSLVGFRFPPINSTQPVQYDDVKRDCFRSLYSLTRAALAAILETALGGGKASSRAETLRHCLKDASHPREVLFGKNGDGHVPFANASDAFSTSFFNLFHYNHGLLNVHKDRCLVTAIFADVPQPASDGGKPKSALWVRGATGSWQNVDAQIEANEVVFLVGQDMEAIAAEMGIPLYAAEHCIRVDPDGEPISRSHFRPDPDTSTTHNRASAAFILSDQRVSRD